MIISLHVLLSSAARNWSQNRSLFQERRVAVATLDAGTAWRNGRPIVRAPRSRAGQGGQPIQMSQRTEATPIEMDSGWDRIR